VALLLALKIDRKVSLAIFKSNMLTGNNQRNTIILLAYILYKVLKILRLKSHIYFIAGSYSSVIIAS